MAPGGGDPSRIHYTEDWASDDDLRKHVRSDRFPRLLEVMAVALDPPSLDFELAEGHRGLDYVQEALRDLTASRQTPK